MFLGEYPREEKHICMSHVSAIVWAIDEEVLRSLWSAPRMLILAWFSVMKVCLCLTVKSFVGLWLGCLVFIVVFYADFCLVNDHCALEERDVVIHCFSDQFHVFVVGCCKQCCDCIGESY